MKYFEKGIVTFFAGGTGHPYFSTDTDDSASGHRDRGGGHLSCQRQWTACTTVTRRRTPNAKKYDEVSIQEVIDKKLAGGGYDGVHHVYGEQDADAAYSA